MSTKMGLYPLPQITLDTNRLTQNFLQGQGIEAMSIETIHRLKKREFLRGLREFETLFDGADFASVYRASDLLWTCCRTPFF